MLNLDKQGKIDFKNGLKQQCLLILQERIYAASQAMQAAQEAANSEGKSSAGDKYETSRAMGQLDRDMNAKQLDSAQKDLLFIQSLPVDIIHQKVQKGSVVCYGEIIGFVSAGLGLISLGDKKVMTFSPASPVASAILNKSTGNKFELNGKTYLITELF